MKKNTVLYILLAVLIIMNGFFLFNYLGRPQQKGPRESGNFIAKELKLNEAQIEQFKLLEDKHHKAMKAINNNIKSDKDALFNNITAPSMSHKTVDSLIESITNKESIREKEMFSRLRSLYELCNDEQKERFSEILKNARQFDNRRPKKPRREE
ncbi:Spy/CpxP family protein refolding chaperone [Lacinutrix chionoecetis]